MESERPKVLHEVAGASLIRHALRAAARLRPARTVVVASPDSEQVLEHLDALGFEGEVAIQERRLGTGDAVLAAGQALKDFSGNAIVLYADTPFVRTETLAGLATARNNGADIAVLGFEAPDPGNYGRIIRNENGSISRIVEAKDASEAEARIGFCNSGVLCADWKLLCALLEKVGNGNSSGEYYLTDVVGIASDQGMHCVARSCSWEETLGVNSRPELVQAESIYQKRARWQAIEGGAHLIDPDTVHMSFDTELAKDSIVEPFVFFGTGVRVGKKARIRAFSHLEGCQVESGAVVGPYARLRPGTSIESGAKIGNFVEVKASRIGQGTKVSHLSYIGDTEIGYGSNIGAGTVTCNYDGVEKHRTRIGDNAFIGSNTIIVAPVKVGNEAMTAAGSVITSDVEDGALAVARKRQENKAGLAKRTLARFGRRKG